MEDHSSLNGTTATDEGHDTLLRSPFFDQLLLPSIGREERTGDLPQTVTYSSDSNKVRLSQLFLITNFPGFSALEWCFGAQLV